VWVAARRAALGEIFRVCFPKAYAIGLEVVSASAFGVGLGSSARQERVFEAVPSDELKNYKPT
jgi:hypothetical protein